MRRKKALIYLAGVIAVALLALGFTFKVGNAPLLGLDLEGGVSVVLTPVTTATDDQLEQAIAIMNQRINSKGVAEPDIHQQGGQIIVQIAGLKDSDKDDAIRQVGQTAELRFRPVLCDTTLLQQGTQSPACTSLAGALTAPTTTPGTTPGTQPATTSGTTGVGAGNATDSTTPPTGSAGQQTGMGVGVAEGESAAGVPTQDTGTTVAQQSGTTAATTGGTTPGATGQAAAGTPIGAACQALSTASPTGPSSAEQDNKPDSVCKQVILPDDPRMVKEGASPQPYLLGPACQPPEGATGSCLTGSALEGAKANINTKNGQWIVNPVFKGGADGIDKFNAIASQCNQRQASCPTGRLAMTLDGYVVSAPSINAPTFQADQIEISGSFTEDTARNLATSLNYGALPVQFKQQAAEQVSATIGRDALNAGLWAGFIGFVLVTIYMLVFYRVLGLLAIFKLAIEGALLWSIISYFGATAGLALTLAGVTGIIVSIGVSLDSNVVYYEHLREDLRNGRTLRSSVDRSFTGAIGTIWKADGASLLGAALLYTLAVGPVRGFAFFLGLSTILDLISSYFYMHPVVFLATQTKLCQRRPGLFGLGGALAKTTTDAAAPADRPVASGVPARPSKGARKSSRGAGTRSSSSAAGAAVAVADAEDEAADDDVELVDERPPPDELVDDIADDDVVGDDDTADTDDRGGKA